jgi:hypothetical protein
VVEFTPKEGAWMVFSRRLGGPQGFSEGFGEEKILSTPAGIRTRIPIFSTHVLITVKY